MLHFAAPMRPGTKAHRVVSESLEYFLACLREQETDEDVSELREACDLTCFTPRQLVTETRKLLKAHKDSRHLYQPTEYHWLLLGRILQGAIDSHNDWAETARISTLKCLGLRKLDFELFRERWFWDTDYDLSPGTVNKMAKAHKDIVGLAEGTFACINRLPAHESDLAMKKMPLPGKTTCRT